MLYNIINWKVWITDGEWIGVYMEYEDEVMESLNQLGVLTSKVMPVFLNDKDYYIRTLQSFTQENEVEQLKHFVHIQDMDTAMNHAYNITALTGTLGLENAYHISKQICRSIRNQNYDILDESIMQLESIYAKLKSVVL